ncbi:hypothetical protein ACOANU_28675 [Pseudomonas aeruginosa]|nr:MULTISPECIES: hypothetical protein [Pseudomonas]EKJ8513852.1 hypothetical protein [Pseudomonas aeruginosa]ELK7308891.1 hypothetical protein [Pseudomonas aeruginosa]MBH3785043.1 hypothetical protein [Pseudomonas aeruginosa]MBM2596540.1 hypothetical protein [Pseudomonas sp. BDPW]NYU72005.1 hypothetical protein [Pseudomonas aeruginosa]
MGNKAARTAMAGSYGKQAQGEGAGMSDDKVVPMKKREDRYEALIRDEADFDALVMGAIKFGQDHGLPESMMKGILMSAIIDLDFNCIVFEPEDGA